MCERITHFCIVAVLFNYFSKIERAFILPVYAHAVEIDGEFAVHQVHSALHVGHGKLFATRNFGSSSLIIRNYLRTFECVACGGVGDGAAISVVEIYCHFFERKRHFIRKFHIHNGKAQFLLCALGRLLECEALLIIAARGQIVGAVVWAGEQHFASGVNIEAYVVNLVLGVDFTFQSTHGVASRSLHRRSL